MLEVHEHEQMLRALYYGYHVPSSLLQPFSLDTQGMNREEKCVL